MKIIFTLVDDKDFTIKHEIALNPSIGETEISKLKNDGNLLQYFAENYKDEICKIVELSSNGSHKEASELAKEIGFTEETFASNGGEWIGIAIGIAALLASQSAY